MIYYVLDSSAVWRLLRDRELSAGWDVDVDHGAIGSCAPQRAEFRRSARSRDEYEDYAVMFADLYPDVALPKHVWRWVDYAQHRLLRGGAHGALSAVDLAVCGVAALQGLTVLHDDDDFVTAARLVPDVRQRRVLDGPG